MPSSSNHTSMESKENKGIMNITKAKPNYINHIALVLDASGSMDHLQKTVVKVADQTIKDLATRSKEMEQETRVSVYTFDYWNNINCVIFDKDVLRLPSIQGLYQTHGQTALIDATLKAIDDLETTSTIYGDHSFLIYVLTDGQENNSRNRAIVLEEKLKKLADNWTLACFVPNAQGAHYAKGCGFQKDNVSIWDSTTERGLEEVGEKIRQTTDAYYTIRSKGFRGSRNLFSLGDIDAKQVKQNLSALHYGQFRVIPVDVEGPIAEFVERHLRRPYRSGEAYYQLMKPETIQPQKAIALYSKDHKVYVGREARQILGLPDYEVRVNPSSNLDYEVFVQSTSVNRKLIPGTKLLVLS